MFDKYSTWLGRYTAAGKQIQTGQMSNLEASLMHDACYLTWTERTMPSRYLIHAHNLQLTPPM